jgi:hypothetical protein
VVFGIRSFVVSAKGAFHRINAGVLLEIVEEGHSGSRFLVFLIAEPAIIVNKEW